MLSFVADSRAELTVVHSNRDRDDLFCPSDASRKLDRLFARLYLCGQPQNLQDLSKSTRPDAAVVDTIVLKDSIDDMPASLPARADCLESVGELRVRVVVESFAQLLKRGQRNKLGHRLVLQVVTGQEAPTSLSHRF